jgi:hypothetical protein
MQIWQAKQQQYALGHFNLGTSVQSAKSFSMSAANSKFESKLA